LVISSHFGGELDVGMPGNQVAEEVCKGSCSICPNCKYFIQIPVPEFLFHRVGSGGFLSKVVMIMLNISA